MELLECNEQEKEQTKMELERRAGTGTGWVLFVAVERVSGFTLRAVKSQ